MKKRNILFAIYGLGLITVTNQALANHVYMSAKIGYSKAQDFSSAATDITAASVNGIAMDFDGGAIYGVNIGYEFYHQGRLVPRVEFEIARQKNDVDEIIAGNGMVYNHKHGDFTLTTYLFQALVDYDLGNCLRPYLGLGIGFGNVDADARYSSFTYHDSDTKFTMRGMAGIGYDIGTYNIFLEGSYLTVNNPEFVRQGPTGVTNHRGHFDTLSLIAGFRFRFS